MKQRTCVLFVFHAWNDFVAVNLERFASAADGLCDFFPAYHQKGEIPPSFNNDSLILFTDNDVFDVIQHSKDRYGKVTPGNCDLSFLAICRKLPDYDLYIRVEYDVLAISDPKAALEQLLTVAQGHDLGGSFFSGGYGNGWMWWPTLHVPVGPTSEFPAFARRAFFPIMSFSKQFISVYERALADGWRGHYEVLAPTIAQYFDRKVVDFSASQPPLTSSPQFHHIEPEDVESTKCAFVHPVKSIGALQKLEEIRKL